ncbi:MAG: hypothetical protein IKA31_00105, partial [Clostridia bacterium]|nr:hypothetical protein [Clostridia bacterium]
YETTATEHKDAYYKLPTKTLAEDIVVMPMWAEDMGTTAFADFQKLDITIINLTDTNRPTVFSSSNKIGDTDATAPVNKELVFNRTNITINDATQFDTGINLKSGNKYRVTYTATDKAGKTATKEYTFEVVADLTYETPSLEWVDVLPNSITAEETISFSAPKYSDSIEDGDSLYKVVEYSLDNGATWSDVELKNNKYVIELPENTLATQVKIRATASNNGIASSVNTVFDSADYRYNHNTGILEKTISIDNVQDAQVPDITNIGAVSGTLIQGNEVVLPSVTVSDDIIGNVSVSINCYHIDTDTNKTQTNMSVYDVITYTTSGLKHVENAKINASRSGEYRVEYRATDAANNIAIQYYTFEVLENPDLFETRFTNLPTEINGGKLELGEKTVLTIPTVVKPEASTATWYVKQLSGPSDAVKGDNGQYYFEPTKVGTYKIQYVGDVLNQDSTHDDILSKVYTIVVEDTTNPEYYISTEIPQQLAKDATFVIPVFSADDLGTGINEDASYVRLSCPSQTYNAIYLKDLKDKSTSDLTMTLKYQEEYTLTYYVVDNAGNSTTKTFKLAVGDTQKPEITLKDNVLKQDNKTITNTAKKGKPVSVDLSQIEVDDNVDKALTVNDVVITLKNTTLDKTVDSVDTTGDGKYSWNIETAGNYEITFKLTDDAGHTQTVTKTFTVDAEDNEGIDSNDVWGTV